MIDALTLNLEATQSLFHREIEALIRKEKDLLKEHRLTVEKLDALKKTAALIASSLSCLSGQDIPGRPQTLGKRIPFAWGDGTKVAYGILREARVPLSVRDLARESLKTKGQNEPTAKMMKAMSQVLYGSLKTQVEKGRVKQISGKPLKFSMIDPIASALEL